MNIRHKPVIIKEDPCLYEQVKWEFFGILDILSKNNLNIRKYINKWESFVDAVILALQDHFPVNANLFRTTFNQLSERDKMNFSRIYIQPFFIESVPQRVGELLRHKG